MFGMFNWNIHHEASTRNMEFLRHFNVSARWEQTIELIERRILRTSDAILYLNWYYRSQHFVLCSALFPSSSHTFARFRLHPINIRKVHFRWTSSLFERTRLTYSYPWGTIEFFTKLLFPARASKRTISLFDHCVRNTPYTLEDHTWRSLLSDRKPTRQYSAQAVMKAIGAISERGQGDREYASTSVKWRTGSNFGIS